MKILIATDSSRHADFAVEFVRRLALARAQVTVLSVARIDEVPMPSVGAATGLVDWYESARAQAVKQASEHAASAASRLVRDGWSVKSLTRAGHPTDLILQTAAEQHSNLIVVGSRGLGRLSGWLLGSVSQALLHSASCSVCVVRPPPHEVEPDDWQQLLLATDGSEDAQAAAQLMLDLRLNENAVANVLTVLPDIAGSPGWQDNVEVAQALDEKRRREACELVDNVAAKLRERFGVVGAHVSAGDPGHEIIAAARRNCADLIVVGTRGLTGLRHLLLGSVAQKVATYAPCSVLVAKLPASSEQL